MSKWAIVAIPKEDDYVWKVSSEKVPHLTLLFLGEHEVGPESAQIASYLEHAVKTTMCRFGLSVERRGKLGPEDADVLFFGKYGIKKLEDFRSDLLKNDQIAAAYNSVEQFPEWMPHVTLGFPATPAKPDERDYPGFSWMQFDKIAFWTGDSEGPEYVLDERSDRYSDLSMSDRVDEFLSHYGVKGQRWGVRNKSSSAAPASADGSKVEKIRTTAKSSGTNALSNKQLQTAIDRMRLEKQYSELASQTATKSAGQKFVTALIGDIGGSETRRVAKGAASLGVEAALRKAGHDDLATRIKPKKK